MGGEVKLDRDDLKKNNRKELNIWEQASVIVYSRTRTEEPIFKIYGIASVGNLALKMDLHILEVLEC